MSDLKIELQSFLQQWPLGDIRSLREIVNGAVNRVYQVDCRMGTFYLRLYKTKERSVIEREHHLLEHLAAHNLPAVQTLPSRYGSSIVELDGQYGALYFQAPGHQLTTKDLTKVHAQAAGKMLAQIHKALKPLPDAGYRKYSLQWNLPGWLEKAHKIEEVILKKGLEQELDQRVWQRLRAQMNWLQDSKCEHSYVPQFPAQVIHGDYHQGNLFFQRSSVCGIIDWDQAAYMPRAFEVARVASYMFNLEPELTRYFLDSYKAINNLHDDELLDGARAWGCHFDHYIWAAEQIYLYGNLRAQVFVPTVAFEPFEQAWQRI